MRIGLKTGLMVAGLAIWLSGCSGSESVASAEAQIASFHKQLDSEDYKAIWDGAADEMHNFTPQTKLNKFLAAVHKKLGAVVESKQSGWSVNYNTGGKFTNVVMQTRFEHGTGTESFNYIAVGQQLKLAGYNINSADMMIN